MAAKKEVPTPAWVNFTTAGMGGLFGWAIVHPFNTVGIRMNLATASGNSKPLSFLPYLAATVKKEGFMTLYTGIGAGMLRQVFYSTSRFGFFEVFRDELAKHRPTDFLSRLVAGVASGGIVQSFVYSVPLTTATHLTAPCFSTKYKLFSCISCNYCAYM